VNRKRNASGMRSPERTYRLQDDLAELLLMAGPQGYAKATARMFAPGGKYNRGAKKQRYAIT